MNRRSGLTMLEVLISAAILVGIVMATVTLLVTSDDAYRDETALRTQEFMAQQALDRIQAEAAESHEKLIRWSRINTVPTWWETAGIDEKPRPGEDPATRRGLSILAIASAREDDRTDDGDDFPRELFVKPQQGLALDCKKLIVYAPYLNASRIRDVSKSDPRRKDLWHARQLRRLVLYSTEVPGGVLDPRVFDPSQLGSMQFAFTGVQNQVRLSGTLILPGNPPTTIEFSHVFDMGAGEVVIADGFERLLVGGSEVPFITLYMERGYLGALGYPRNGRGTPDPRRSFTKYTPPPPPPPPPVVETPPTVPPPPGPPPPPAPAAPPPPPPPPPPPAPPPPPPPPPPTKFQ